MRYEVEDSKRILVFDDCEEMKWYYHRKMCHGEILETTARFLGEQCLTVDEANQSLERFGEPCRVKKPEEP